MLFKNFFISSFLTSKRIVSHVFHFIFNLLLILFIEVTANNIVYESGKRYATVPIPSSSTTLTLTLALKVGSFEVKSEPFKIVSLYIRLSIYIFNIGLYSS